MWLHPLNACSLVSLYPRAVQTHFKNLGSSVFLNHKILKVGTLGFLGFLIFQVYIFIGSKFLVYCCSVLTRPVA